MDSPVSLCLSSHCRITEILDPSTTLTFVWVQLVQRLCTQGTISLVLSIDLAELIKCLSDRL